MAGRTARSARAMLIGRVRWRPSWSAGRSPNDTASRTPRPHPLSLLNEFRGSRLEEAQRETRAQARANIKLNGSDTFEASSDFKTVNAKRDEMHNRYNNKHRNVNETKEVRNT